MVESGLLMVSGLRPGHLPRTVGFYFPNEVIALDADRSMLALEIKALQPSCLQVFDVDGRTRNSKLGVTLLERFCQQLATERQARFAVTSRHIDQRVATFILDLAERSGAGHAAKLVIKLPMRRCDIADYLGIRVETLSRLLTAWRVAGVIRLPTPREAEVLDRAYLERLVSAKGATSRSD